MQRDGYVIPSTVASPDEELLRQFSGNAGEAGSISEGQLTIYRQRGVQKREQAGGRARKAESTHAGLERDVPLAASDASHDLGLQCVVRGEVEAVTKDSVGSGAGCLLRGSLRATAGPDSAFECSCSALFRCSPRRGVGDRRACDFRKDVGSPGVGVSFLLENKEDRAFAGKIAACVPAFVFGEQAPVDQMGEHRFQLDERIVTASEGYGSISSQDGIRSCRYCEQARGGPIHDVQVRTLHPMFDG